MEVELTPDQQAFVQLAIRNGRYRSAEDAVREAMLYWEERERARAELTAAIDEADADLDAGRFRDYTDAALSMLAEELKNEGRAIRSANELSHV